MDHKGRPYDGLSEPIFVAMALLMLAVCVGCGGARPMLVTPSPNDTPATRPSDVSRPVPSPVGTRASIPYPPATLAPLPAPNETTTAATLRSSNETTTAATLPGSSQTSTVTPLPPTPTPTPSPTPASVYEVLELNASVMIGDVLFPAELAVNSVERTKGLSERDGLEPGTGMLFIFESREVSSFWMRKVRFSLDFVWISEDCRVVDITAKVPFPKPGTDTSDLPSYRPSAPAAYNFEINGGEADEFGIRVGDAVRFTGIPDHLGDTCE